MEKPTKRILSGVQPSGDLHLGNYLGAIKNFVSLQKEYECFFCVVDLHAITVWQDPKVLADKTREVTAAFIASEYWAVSRFMEFKNEGRIALRNTYAWWIFGLFVWNILDSYVDAHLSTFPSKRLDFNTSSEDSTKVIGI